MDVSKLVADNSSISDRLERRFGLGTRADLRRALYLRLEALCNHSDPSVGERAYQVIASAVADAHGKLKPGNYFASVVMARLQERGLIEARPSEF